MITLCFSERIVLLLMAFLNSHKTNLTEEHVLLQLIFYAKIVNDNLLKCAKNLTSATSSDSGGTSRCVYFILRKSKSEEVICFVLSRFKNWRKVAQNLTSCHCHLQSIGIMCQNVTFDDRCFWHAVRSENNVMTQRGTLQLIRLVYFPSLDISVHCNAYHLNSQILIDAFHLVDKLFVDFLLQVVYYFCWHSDRFREISFLYCIKSFHKWNTESVNKLVFD